MSEPFELSAIFLEHAAVRVAIPNGPGEFEGLLLCACETGRGDLQRVNLTNEEFIRHLAQRLHKKFEGAPLAQVFEKLALADLYLACACLKPDPEALNRLDREYLTRLAELLTNSRLSQDALAEIRQLVWIQIVVGTGKSKPELAAYRGLGSLRRWIQIVASHLVRKQGAPSQVTPYEDAQAVIEGLPAPDDPEFDALKRSHLPELLEAMSGAFSTLSPKQRYLLRLHFRDRLSTIKIAQLHGVNQSTIWRDIKGALDAVHEEMKRQLQERLRLSTHDFESLVNALRSQFNLSISQILAERSAEETKKSEGGKKEGGR